MFAYFDKYTQEIGDIVFWKTCVVGVMHLFTGIYKASNLALVQ